MHLIGWIHPSGDFILEMLTGAFFGAVSSAFSYTIGAAINGQWSWSSFGNAIAFGAVSGALSGGLSVFTPSLGAFGNTIAAKMLNQVGSTVLTNTLYGNKFSTGSFVGTLVGSLISASMPGFTGLDGGWLKNSVAELGFNSLKGAYIGGFSGAFSGMIDGSTNGMVEGMVGGAIQGASNTILMNIAFGAPSKSIYKYHDFKENKPNYREGGIASLLRTSGGITIGRDLWTKTDNDKMFDEYLHYHERGHYFDENESGYAHFYSKTILDYVTYGFEHSYDVKGTFENKANIYAYDRLHYFYNSKGFNSIDKP